MSLYPIERRALAERILDAVRDETDRQQHSVTVHGYSNIPAYIDRRIVERITGVLEQAGA